jgi:hydroxycarboxylate dehydrogenase B
MQRYSAQKLKELVLKIFLALGATEKEAFIVSEHLIENNLLGHDSHGIIRVLQYAKEVEGEQCLNLGAKLQLLKQKDSIALMDANFCLGPVAGIEATEKAIKLAKNYGIGSVTVMNTHHTGRLGTYTSLAAKNNMIGLACVNWAKEEAMGVVPFGGREGRISTDPISFACPRNREYPFLVDMATSVVAEGKIRISKNRNEKIPEGWILNKKGQLSDNPEDYYNGGAILPLGGIQGGHKGFALGLVVEILAGALSKNKPIQKNVKQEGQGLFILVLDIEKYISLKEFKEEIEKLFVHVKDTPTMQGYDEVIIPGEIEFKRKQENIKKGVFIERKTWEEIVKLSGELNIDTKNIIESGLE